jgi:hypothetical protein
MDRSAIFTRLATADKYIILKVIAAILLLWGLIYIIRYVTYKYFSISSPSTVKRTKNDRVALLNKRIEPLINTKKSIYDSPLPENQSLLLNYQVQSCRLAGYLSPLQDGVFAEEDAVRLALGSGCRLFVIEISKGHNGRPALIARDSMGYKRSLNEGSIAKVCSALASGSRGEDPLILALYFYNAPDKAKDPKAYLNYLSQVAKALAPLIPNHLGLTGVGDFTRQKKESELFTFAPEFYKNKVLILCNIDTSLFRDPTTVGVTKKFSPNEDLDFFVHCRLYKQEAGGDLGMTTTATGGSAAKAVICNDSYFLLTPPDKVEGVVNSTRNQFTIVLKSDPSYMPSKEVSKRLLDSFGIHSIPVSLDSSVDTTLAAFKKNIYRAKPLSLRFTKPVPIVPKVPNKALDANGGSVVAPKL